jgi:hypothetical protein
MAAALKLGLALDIRVVSSNKARQPQNNFKLASFGEELI